MVLAAVGKNGTGKDFFLEYVAKNYGFPMISIGDVVRELAANDGLELTRDNLHATSKKYMSENGQDFFPKQIIKKIKESDAPCYLVSGIRPPSDAELFKDAFGDDFFLVDVVISDDEVRYARMLARGSERDGKDVDKLREFDKGEEAQFHTSETEKMANVKLLNDGGVEDFYAAADDLCAKLGFTKITAE
ncbi:MAG: AAA family ATPase [Clostridia bacterium]|nr:AAA family ATPase [Clostridia bacterium]